MSIESNDNGKNKDIRSFHDHSANNESNHQSGGICFGGNNEYNGMVIASEEASITVNVNDKKEEVKSKAKDKVETAPPSVIVASPRPSDAKSDDVDVKVEPNVSHEKDKNKIKDNDDEKGFEQKSVNTNSGAIGQQRECIGILDCLNGLLGKLHDVSGSKSGATDRLTLCNTLEYAGIILLQIIAVIAAIAMEKTIILIIIDLDGCGLQSLLASQENEKETSNVSSSGVNLFRAGLKFDNKNDISSGVNLKSMKHSWEIDETTCFPTGNEKKRRRMLTCANNNNNNKSNNNNYYNNNSSNSIESSGTTARDIKPGGPRKPRKVPKSKQTRRPHAVRSTTPSTSQQQVSSSNQSRLTTQSRVSIYFKSIRHGSWCCKWD